MFWEIKLHTLTCSQEETLLAKVLDSDNSFAPGIQQAKVVSTAV
ncbi:serine protease pet autotransporter domain protein [Shigella flexneri CCH060]|uniref:Serine protease pet autotransporter domain protein n=1 Tax=Shigella flexneri CCH060 TaxID=754091 RepID=A0A6N3QV57_SHIFL|nr:serine protease pet autotransporter domain protein [Shigella flexneri CCH060]EIQ06381.1 serine protease pet autotransporter domain protein [Shigella flexneri CCH060]